MEGKKGKKNKKERERREVEKLANSGALLIAETQYDLFRNMQIRKSLCLVYQREPPSLKRRGGGAARNRSTAHLTGTGGGGGVPGRSEVVPT